MTHVVLWVATSGLLFAGCSPRSGASALGEDPSEMLPSGAAETLERKRLNVVWAPEMTSCSVCNAPIAEALTRFAEDYPEAGVVTAVVAGVPFPENLVVGTKVAVPEPGGAGPDEGVRPYFAILDADRRLLAWRRIPELGRQDELVYQELLGAYSLTAPLE